MCRYISQFNSQKQLQKNSLCDFSSYFRLYLTITFCNWGGNTIP